MSEKNVCAKAEFLAKKVCNACGVDLWDVEYKKEGASFVLRVFIDKEDGISSDDCERVSRMMDPMLDEEDFIDQSYCFEVSSPGIDRKLTKPEHFESYLGAAVDIKLFKALDGIKELNGVTLVEYHKDTIRIEQEEKIMDIELVNAAYVRLSFTFS